MDKEEIKQRLKGYSKVKGLKLPGSLDLSIENKVLKVYISNPTVNMQKDGVAFEGWILVLKSWLHEDIDQVELDFTVPTNIIEHYGSSEVGHYNRFLYRIYNMLRIYPEWFFIDKSKILVVEELMNWIKSNHCLLNHSLKDRVSFIKTEKMERQIESWFVFEDGKEQLCKHWDMNSNKLFNQLPIGVFYNEINAKNAIFTRGASAIDLWGIGNDEKTLHLIELKYGKNISIGVISEILFYIAVIYDSCIAQDSLFKFGKYKNKSDTTDTTAIKNSGGKFDYLFAHILSERLHPLFNNNVEKLVIDGLSNLNIGFDRVLYDYSKKALINEDYDL